MATQRTIVSAAFVAAAALTLSACANEERYAQRMQAYAQTKPAVEIRVPQGAGPFPAVVVLHNCGGLDGAGARTTYDWVEFLLANGYATVIPDSFRPRDLSLGVCERPGFMWPNQTHRGADAYAALALAQADARIDRRRIAVMGGSNGGVATLAAANADMIAANGWLAAGQPGFAHAIAFYPECGISYGEWKVEKLKPLTATGAFRPAMPLTILTGALDNWTPASACEAMVKVANGAPVRLKIYPDAHHSFDSPTPGIFQLPRAHNINSPGNTTVGQNVAARTDSRREVLAILASLPGG